MTAYLVYITAAGEDEARKLGRALIEARLAAGVNIIPHVRSLYRWRGEVHDEREAAVIAKTRDSLVEALIAKVKELHSYECPCVVALPIVAGNPDYLDWIEAETGGGLKANRHEPQRTTANRTCGTSEATISFAPMPRPRKPQPTTGKKTTSTTAHKMNPSRRALRKVSRSRKSAT